MPDTIVIHSVEVGGYHGLVWTCMDCRVSGNITPRMMDRPTRVWHPTCKGAQRA